ncbi:hypothetical protein PoB_002702500 [Plakobranchus ocellatus]|uniref:Uncharacterized protein n=1 Tax=Plakobranchus ocellatus TaxID=259542 RepID=A0AAV3ZXC4_9GAST|nr:hypothetical protein PoB_002702500 [Plakobranchus ocellatus]
MDTVKSCEPGSAGVTSNSTSTLPGWARQVIILVSKLYQAGGGLWFRHIPGSDLAAQARQAGQYEHCETPLSVEHRSNLVRKKIFVWRNLTNVADSTAWVFISLKILLCDNKLLIKWYSEDSFGRPSGSPSRKGRIPITRVLMSLGPLEISRIVWRDTTYLDLESGDRNQETLHQVIKIHLTRYG